MSESISTQSELALRIVSELINHKLIAKSHEALARQKIIGGNVSAEDWLLWVELPADEQSTNEETAHG